MEDPLGGGHLRCTVSQAPLFTFLGAATIILQRIGLPIGDSVLPVAPVMLLVALAWLLLARKVHLSPPRVIALCAFGAYGAALSMLPAASITSYLQVFLLWLPFVIALPQGAPQSFLNGVVFTTMGAALAGIVQSAYSAAFGVFLDPFDALPTSLLVKGFNTSYEVVYGSGWMKANGFVFLEASFLSLFSGISIIAVVTRAATLPRWLRTEFATALLIVGLVSSVAVSALVLIPVMIVWMFLNARRTWKWMLVGGLLWPTIASIPAVSAFILRAADTETSSNGARLVRPYDVLVPQVLDNSPLVGFGPGTARVQAASLYVSWHSEVTTPTLVKTLFEYGLLGAAFLLAACACLATTARIPLLMRVALLISLLVPTDGLTSGVLVPLVLITMASTFSPLDPNSDLQDIPLTKGELSR